jgi:hypothetical protein
MTFQKLNSLLSYDPDTGHITWRISKGRVRAGSAAGSISGNGYLYIRVDKKNYSAHRLAWLLFYRSWPAVLDHINRNKLDNRICNLRQATPSENGANRGVQKNSRSGLKGVHKANQANGWQAQIKINGKVRHLGTFDTPEEASAAYNASSRKLFGPFAHSGDS